MKRWAIAALVLMACVRVPYRDPVADVLRQHAAPGSKQYGAPGSTLEARPWQLGQWTMYKRRVGEHVLLETIKIIARDACGFWIEYEVREHLQRWRWTFCVRQQPAADEQRLYESLWALIARRDDVVVAADDFRQGSADRTGFAWLVEYVHAPWAGHAELPREDITTPDGQFAQAVKARSQHGSIEITQWSHPEIPLGGLVREIGSDDHERVLLQHGTSNVESSFVIEGHEQIRLQQRQQRKGMFWFGMQFGYDSLGNIDGVNQTFGSEFSTGIWLAPRLDLVSGVGAIGGAPYDADPMLEENLLLIQLGARWMPFGRPTKSSRPFADLTRRSLWVQADVGYAELDRAPISGELSAVGRGLGVGARVGISLMLGRDWSYGLAIHDHIAVLNSSEGLRHSFGLSGDIQLFAF